MNDAMKTLSSDEPSVTVVIPVFGSHKAVETVAVVCRAWLEQDVPCEVVVASARGADDLGWNGAEDSRLRVLTLGSEVRSLSTLRNAAVSVARAPMVYLADADVAPLGRNFMRRALEAAGDRVFAQPWMYRVLNSWNGGVRDAPRGVSRRSCFVRADADGELVPVEGERFAWRKGVLWVCPPPGAIPDDPTSDEWRVPCHWGAVLLKRHLFELVGGYCEDYVGWGGEDDDLLFKLSGHATVVQAWRTIPALACLHAEHPRPTKNEEVSRNRQLLARRISAGQKMMIDTDVAEMRRRAPVNFEKSPSW